MNAPRPHGFASQRNWVKDTPAPTDESGGRGDEFRLQNRKAGES